MVTVTDATEALDEAIAAPHLARHHHCLAASPDWLRQEMQSPIPAYSHQG
jgi:hypothetical protein